MFQFARWRHRGGSLPSPIAYCCHYTDNEAHKYFGSRAEKYQSIPIKFFGIILLTEVTIKRQSTIFVCVNASNVIDEHTSARS